jgi:LysM repeat protein
LVIIKFFIILIITLLISTLGFSQKKQLSKEEYINLYKKIAIEEMRRSGIPASITLAQGMVESDNGNSTLAVKANNHFGIKCHNWEGKKVYHDDDTENECFRKYASAEDSYRDHTDFLMKTKRYDFLFSYKSDDYKKWAKGLKKAGYATSSTYTEDLLRVIEENNLHVYDEGNIVVADRKRRIEEAKIESDEFTIDIKRRKIYEKNRIKYIVVEEGDNLEKIDKDLDLFSWQIKKYNELSDTSQISPGDILYIQPKRWKAEVGNDFHEVKTGETMYSISQLYGIQLKKLYRKNRMKFAQEPVPGQKIWLRKRKPKNETI